MISNFGNVSRLEVVLLPLLIILLNGTDGYAMPKKMVHPNKSSNRDPPICKTPECYAAGTETLHEFTFLLTRPYFFWDVNLTVPS